MRAVHQRRIAALLSTLALLGGTLAGCGGDDEPDEAFTFVDDDLCEWITANEVAKYLTAAYDWDGTVEVMSSSDFGEDECSWRLSTTTRDGVDAASVGLGLSYDDVFASVGNGQGIIGGDDGYAPWSGHPALSEGVLVQDEGWGIYAFQVPPRDEYLVLRNEHHGFGVMARDDDLFALADMLVHELGWTTR